MARNPFAAVAVPGSVTSEFAARADAAKLLKWTSTRVPWIHLMSMANTCGSTFSPLGNTAGGFAVFGGSPETSMYDTDTLLPWPIITGMDVTALGSLGTTRKSVVKLKCFTDEHLIELQKCYFIPGMDVRVQWGWSESCTGTAPTIYSGTGARAESVCQLLQISSPANDGFQGIVANFKYGLQSDNSWDCELEINSPAEAFSQSNISSTECGCARKNEIETEGEKKELAQKNGEMYAFFLDSFKNSAACGEWIGKLTSAAPAKLKQHIAWESRNYLGKARTEAGGDDSSFYEGTWFNDYDTTEQYVTWGAVEAAINCLALPNDPDFSYGMLDTSEVQFDHVNKYSLAMCVDPRIAHMPGGSDSHAGTMEGKGGSAGDAYSGGLLTLCNMRINVLFLKLELKKVLDGDKQLLTFVRNVLNELNRVCGNCWDIQVVSDSETERASCEGGNKGGRITVVDNKKAVAAGTTWQVPSTSTTSAIRGMNLDLKMTSAMKTQALYSNGTQQKGGGNTGADGDANGCEGAAFEPFGLGKRIKNSAMPSARPAAPKECFCDQVSDVEKADSPTLSGLQKETGKYVSDETVNALLSQLTGDIAKLSDDGVPDHCKGTQLPFDFGFECDGIGGFKFGQFISSDRLPPDVAKGWDFQVMKVEHSVTANDWTTKVNTIARRKS